MFDEFFNNFTSNLLIYAVFSIGAYFTPVLDNYM